VVLSAEGLWLHRLRGEKDVFVHITGLAPGTGSLAEEQTVEFEVKEGQKGPQAVNVRPA